LNKKVLILGAGISGLSTAFWLKQNGIDVKLFEKNSYTGGSIRTEKINDYIIEHGPNSALETTPLIDKLINELGISNKKIYANDNAKKRYILRNGKLHALPMSPLSFLSTKLFSFSAKMRLFKEPFIKSKSNPYETIAEFTERRLGTEFLDYAINPFVAGVFAGNPKDLNVKTAFPRLYELEQNYGSLIGGAIKSRRERKKRAEASKQSAKTFSFLNGMNDLTSAISERLKNDILTQVEVSDICKINNKFSVNYKIGDETRNEVFDSVVISAPAYTASKLIQSFAPEVSSVLSAVYYPPVNVIITSFKREQFDFIPDGFGYLVPEKENSKILGSLWNTVIFPNRAPKDEYVLTNFIGGSRNADLTGLNDDELLKITLCELSKSMGVKGQPVFSKIIRWERAIPQYRKNYSDVFDMLDKFHIDNPGLFLCNNYYRGISVGDCIKSADQTVTSVLKYLKIISP
jgi:protoporphyrinogen/coproporphyrinogen III oxidase